MMDKSIFSNSKGNLHAGAILLIVGASALLISTYIGIVLVQELVGEPVTYEYLGNTTVNNYTSFTTDFNYATGTHYIAFALWNQSMSGTACSSGTAITACGTGNCFEGTFGSNNITVNGTGTGSGYQPGTGICINYTSTNQNVAGGLTTQRAIAANMRTAFNLVGIALIVVGAGVIIGSLTSWGRQ